MPDEETAQSNQTIGRPALRTSGMPVKRALSKTREFDFQAPVKRALSKTTKLDLQAAIQTAFDKALESAICGRPHKRRVAPPGSSGKVAERTALVRDQVVSRSRDGNGRRGGCGGSRPKRTGSGPSSARSTCWGFWEPRSSTCYRLLRSTGLNPEDVERRRLLVMTVLAGNEADANLGTIDSAHVAPHWGQVIVKKIPIAVINKANKILGPRFIVKWNGRQAVIVLGIQVPLFIGAGIGAGGNALFGWAIVKSAKKILGPVPESWDELSEPALGPIQVERAPMNGPVAMRALVGVCRSRPGRTRWA